MHHTHVAINLPTIYQEQLQVSYWTMVAMFPGLPQFQLSIACSMQRSKAGAREGLGTRLPWNQEYLLRIILLATRKQCHQHQLKENRLCLELE